MWKRTYKITPWVWPGEFDECVNLLQKTKYGTLIKGFYTIKKLKKEYIGKCNFSFNPITQKITLYSDSVEKSVCTYFIIELRKRLSEIKNKDVRMTYESDKP